MIPYQHILAWGKIAPWDKQRQIEQDLIISRALVDIFSDDFLRKELRFRGGTALNKLHFPKPFRYSEDIDVVRTSKGPPNPGPTPVGSSAMARKGKVCSQPNCAKTP